MALLFAEIHREHLSFLHQHEPEVLNDFAYAALEYINKGPNQKLYETAANSFNVDTETLQNSLESLVYIFIECCKSKVSDDEFRKLLSVAGFNERQVDILNGVFQKNLEIIRKICSKNDSLLYFYDLRWRFEAKIGSRSLVNQVTPLVTLNFRFSDSPDAAASTNVTDCLLQTDPNTLIRITETLEDALSLSRSHNIRKIERKLKKAVQE